VLEGIGNGDEIPKDLTFYRNADLLRKPKYEVLQLDPDWRAFKVGKIGENRVIPQIYTLCSSMKGFLKPQFPDSLTHKKPIPCSRR
jgi:hypothetical protein